MSTLSEPYPVGYTLAEKRKRIKLALLTAKRAHYPGLSIIELHGNWLRFRVIPTGIHRVTCCDRCKEILRAEDVETGNSRKG
jgi:hypothetical protein